MSSLRYKARIHFSNSDVHMLSSMLHYFKQNFWRRPHKIKILDDTEGREDRGKEMGVVEERRKK